jgi:glycosyltransferase involved in cell wall biosynthesis
VGEVSLMKSEIKVSFLVIAFNEELSIKKTIKSILAQDNLSNFEIIVINDGSTDRTNEIILQLMSSETSLNLINLPKNLGRGSARSVAVKNAHGKYIAFVDADILLPKHWLTRNLEYISKFDACGGTAFPDGDVIWIANFLKMVPKKYLHTISVTGSNSMYKSEIFKKIEFDSSRTLGEDFDFNSKMLGAGYKITTIPDLFVEHISKRSFLESLAWAFKSGEDATKLYAQGRILRGPDLAFFIFSLILFSVLFDSFTKSLYNLPEIILPVFLLSISAVHLFRRFVIKISLLQKMIIASILYSIFVLVYLIGRISGLVKYAWKFQ